MSKLVFILSFMLIISSCATFHKFKHNNSKLNKGKTTSYFTYDIMTSRSSEFSVASLFGKKRKTSAKECILKFHKTKTNVHIIFNIEKKNEVSYTSFELEPGVYKATGIQCGGEKYRFHRKIVNFVVKENHLNNFGHFALEFTSNGIDINLLPAKDKIKKISSVNRDLLEQVNLKNNDTGFAFLNKLKEIFQKVVD